MNSITRRHGAVRPGLTGVRRHSRSARHRAGCHLRRRSEMRELPHRRQRALHVHAAREDIPRQPEERAREAGLRGMPRPRLAARREARARRARSSASPASGARRWTCRTHSASAATRAASACIGRARRTRSTRSPAATATTPMARFSRNGLLRAGRSPRPARRCHEQQRAEFRAARTCRCPRAR